MTVIHRKESVYLRVYDISDGAARMWSPVLFGKRIEGVWHTGIEVFGMEYFYGGGIVKMKPTDVEVTYGITPLRIHHLGMTSLSQREFEKYLFSIQMNFTRESYDLVKWNCNNFTDHSSQFLLQRGIPAYILDLPEELTNTFMGKIIINFIKIFSDAPAIDSEAADHPKQTMNLANNFVKGRRNSCPASPAGKNANPFRKKRTTGEETGVNDTSRQCKERDRKKGPERRRSASIASTYRSEETQYRKLSRRDKLSSISTKNGSLTDRGSRLHERARSRRCSVSALIFPSCKPEDLASTAASSRSSTPETQLFFKSVPSHTAKGRRGSLPPLSPFRDRPEGCIEGNRNSDMSYPQLSAPSEDGVFLLNLGPDENRFDVPVCNKFLSLLKEVESHSGPTALVIHSESSKFFSNGLSFEALMADPENFLHLFHRVLLGLLIAPYPTVAAINGHAFAGGAMIGFCCDYRIMNKDKGFICINEVDLGIPLTPGLATVIKAKADRSEWVDLTLKAKRYGGIEALKCKLINDAVPIKNVLDDALQLAKRYVMKGTNKNIYGAIKKAIYDAEVATLEASSMGYADEFVRRSKAASML